MSGSPISGFAHVAIAVASLAEARRFYCGILGLDEVPRPDLGIDGMWLRVGDLQLHFIETDVMPVPGPGFPHFALHIPDEVWTDKLNELVGAGIVFLMGPSERVDFGVRVRAAFITDPAGNVVELTDAGPLNA
jgi:catechol 2,3-dioxygenase-like lactoylglutathione lyase family enzyme